MTCTHNWTVTSECPRCLREELDQAKEALQWIADNIEELEWVDVPENVARPIDAARNASTRRSS